MRFQFNGWEFGFKNLIDLRECEFESIDEAVAFGHKLKELLGEDSTPGYMVLVSDDQTGWDFASESVINKIFG